MASIGETLRRERQKRDLELDQVSHELKIAPRFLKAIEEERFDRLPGGVFAKSFVRQYARMLDLDEEEAAAEVQRVLAPPLPQFGEQAPAPERIPVAAHSEFSPHVDAIVALPAKRFGTSSWLSALILVVVVMLGCSMFYGWWRDRRAASTAAATTAASHKTNPTVAQAAAPVQQPPATQPPATDQQPAAQQPAAPTTTPVADGTQAAAAQPAPAQQSDAQAPPPTAIAAPPTIPAQSGPPLAESTTALHPAGPVSVQLITSDEPVWVLARTDGKFAFSGIIEPNQTRTVQADGNVVLRVGNAGGVTILLNGKQLVSAGPKGQVRTLQLTSGGFQIVPPKPSTPPAAPI